LTHKGGTIVSHTNRPPLPPRNVASTYFCRGFGRPQSRGAAGRIMSMRKLHRESNPRNVARQPTAPPHITFTTSNLINIVADSRLL